jgi:glycosyltransferase involved in cell wall biosynthesis
MSMRRLGSTALESILCGTSPTGSLEKLVPHVVDAWSLEFPGLDSLPVPEGEPTRLKVCIATEDIVGPVRNGGIGTTYAALSELLAGLGYDVTILYLRGHEIENGSIEQWVEHYAAKNVRFVPVPNYAAADRFQTGADRWLHAPYNMLRYLLDHPMDVVHVSEWRGSGYLSLLAKRQGLAFDETLFIVKTSSPWMWNRLYGSQPLDRLDDLAKVHAERRSVEFADMVIGGSLHLLRWMASQGYLIPRARTFVQPNVVTFDHLKDLINKRSWEPGTRHRIDEIVFFGRLEARKGLFTFCQAIKRLLRQGRKLPPKITFMGKPGARLTARPDQDIADYIGAETAGWPTEVTILTEMQQYDALQYLLGGSRLAVMPSMIENSSLAVYEAAACGIPFVASASGGTPELIAAVDHPHVLFDAHPIQVADKIGEALDLGGYVARPSFDNDANLAQWRKFHVDLGRGLAVQLRRPARLALPASLDVSVCIYHADTDAKLAATLASLAAQDEAPKEILVAVDTDDPGSGERAAEIAAGLGITITVVPAHDLDAGLAFNQLAARSTGEFALFLWAGATLKPMALRALGKVAVSSNADVVNYFYRVTHEGDAQTKDYLCAIIFGSIAQAFYRTDITALPLFVRRSAFDTVGGFTSDYRVLAHDHEFVAKAHIEGLHCETALVELGAVPSWDEAWLREKCYDQSIAQFRAVRPEIAATPLALRDLMLMAKGLQARPPRRGGKPAAKPGAGAVAEKEGPLARLLTALSTDMMSSKPEPAPVRKPPPRPAVAAAARARARARTVGLVQLIEDPPVEAAAEAPRSAAPREARASRPTAPAVIERTFDRTHLLSDVAGQRFSGRILAVHKGLAYGWVRNEERPEDPVVVDLVSGRRTVRSVAANMALPTAMPPSPELQRHGFVLPVNGGLPAWPLRQGQKSMVFQVRGSSVRVGDYHAIPFRRSLKQAGYDGYCDFVDGTVRGWAWAPSDPHVSVDIAVFVDGRFLARVTADAVRDDLRAAGVGSGSYGFAVPFPKALRDGTPRQVDVVLAECGLHLNRGRQRLVGNTLTPVG